MRCLVVFAICAILMIPLTNRIVIDCVRLQILLCPPVNKWNIFFASLSNYFDSTFFRTSILSCPFQAGEIAITSSSSTSPKGQPFSLAHFRQERWQPLAAAAQVYSSHCHLFSLAHSRMERWPLPAAALQGCRLCHGI